ncbi:cytidylate kinase-like family protein [Faecalimonas umbilicata]|nr:cytidylate kinase-like family protein [Faecalimonas umbilicata]
MSRIITIGREFGSGGRELGRRLAEELQIAYYDKEIITEISKRTSLSEKYVQHITENRPVISFPIHVGRSFYPSVNPILQKSQELYQEQKKIIIEMAEKSDCIIVGRCADYILADRNPFRIFVYADVESKMKRCREKADEHEHFSDKELLQHIKEIDRNRSKYYEFYTDQKWGDKLNYDLCINTTGAVIKNIVPSLAKLF